MSNMIRPVVVSVVAGALLAGCGRPERAPQEPAITEEERREQVEHLLRKSLDQLALHEYEQADRTIEEILAQDPGNAEALKLRELAVEHRHHQAQGNVYDRRRPEEEPLSRSRSRSRAGGPRPSADVVEGERLVEEGRYAEAEACFRRALALEPGNQEALGLLTWAQQLAASERARDGMEDVTVSYTPGAVVVDSGHWAKVRHRTIGIVTTRSGEPDWIRDYRQVLKSRKVTLNFPDTPLAEVISFLQDITGLNITVSPAVDQEELTVSLRLREIPLEDALRIILEQTQLAMTFANETLMITPPDVVRKEYDLEIYDAQDLLGPVSDFIGERIRISTDGSETYGAGSFSFDTEEEPDDGLLDPDQLETIVTNAVGEDHWDDPASIEVHRGQIIVNQTRELHSKIRDVLQHLRLDKRLETGPFVRVAAVHPRD